jgi:probable O-glycosylation ligase (exosortase A-associated)
MRDLLLVGFLFVAIYYSFKRPYLGVCAWVWIALTAPTNWAFGFSQSFRLNFTIVIVTALSYLFVMKNKSFRPGGVGLLVLAFGFWTLVSTAFTLKIDPSWVWNNWVQFMKVVALFLFVLLVFRRKLHLNTFVWAIVLSISSYAGMEAVKFILSGGGHRIVGRAGIIADRNDLAVAINMCIPLIVYLIYATQHRWLRLGLWGLLVLNVIAVVGTYSRGGFIGLSILAIAMWMNSRYKIWLSILALLLLPVMYQFAPQDWKERQSTISTATEVDGSFIGRLWAWKISTLIALDHPITGGGFSAVTDPVLWNSYAPETPDFGPIYTAPIPPGLKPKAAHNVYFQVLGDHGFVGLFIFLGILVYAFFNNRSNMTYGRRSGYGWYARLASALNLGLVGYGITGANVSLAYFDLLYAVFGLVAVMKIYRPELLEGIGETPTDIRTRVRYA